MQVKFQETLQQYGVTAEQTTKKIVEMVSAFDEVYSQYQESVDNLDTAENSEEREMLMGEIDIYRDSLRDLDSDIVKKIESWDKNKEVWAKGQAALAEKRAAKKSGSVEGATATASIQSEPTPQPIPVEGVPVNSSFQGDGGVIKKKSNGGWWILAGIVGIVTLGAVVMKKE